MIILNKLDFKWVQHWQEEKFEVNIYWKKKRNFIFPSMQQFSLSLSIILNEAPEE